MSDLAARWLERTVTAAYIGKRVDELSRLVKRGLLPEPSYHFGPRSPRWDRHALDALFTGQTVRPSIEAAAEKYALELAARPDRRKRGRADGKPS